MQEPLKIYVHRDRLAPEVSKAVAGLVLVALAGLVCPWLNASLAEFLWIAVFIVGVLFAQALVHLIGAALKMAWLTAGAAPARGASAAAEAAEAAQHCRPLPRAPAASAAAGSSRKALPSA